MILKHGLLPLPVPIVDPLTTSSHGKIQRFMKCWRLTRCFLIIFFIGDEAFTNTFQFLSPWSGRGLDEYKDSFNFWLSHSRQCVERAFGISTQRWGIFWRPFRFAFDRWSLVVMAAMKLHNPCIDRRDVSPVHHYNEDMRPADQWVVYDNFRNDDVELHGRPVGDRRYDLMLKLQQPGIRRPLHASMNSRCD